MSERVRLNETHTHTLGTIHATPLRVIKHTTKATFCHIKIKFQRVISGFLHFLKLHFMVKELNDFRGAFLFNSFDVHVHHIHCVHSISILLQMFIESRVVFVIVIVIVAPAFVGDSSEGKMDMVRPMDRTKKSSCDALTFDWMHWHWFQVSAFPSPMATTENETNRKIRFWFCEYVTCVLRMSCMCRRVWTNARRQFWDVVPSTFLSIWHPHN